MYKLTENDEFLNRCLKVDVDPVSIDIMKNFLSQAVEKSVGGFPPTQNAARTYKKPVALSVPARIPPVPQFELNMVEKRFQLPIFAFREKILKMIEENRILLVQVRFIKRLKFYQDAK